MAYRQRNGPIRQPYRKWTPDGGFSLPGGGQEPSESSDDFEFENFLLIGAIVSFVAAASIWVMRNNAREDSNNIAKEEKVE